MALGYTLRESDPDPGDELAMEMMYGNFDFFVVHSLISRADKILIECVFGEIPESRRRQIIERLFQMNTVLAELDGSAFCLDEEGIKLVYILPVSLLETDGHFLLKKMTEIVWHGRRWLENSYLSENNSDNALHINPVSLA
jgi:hypothetical protein